jgi:lipopolysaccharide export system protein LptA
MNLMQLSIIATCCLISGQIAALTSDRDQPFHIQADGAEIDESTGISIYRGRVNVDQGSMKILADEIEIHTNDSEVIQIIARMHDKNDKLAHYEQQPDADGELITAEAREINYFIQEEKLHLIGKARLYQTPNSFEGELLHYDLQRGIVNLKGRPASEDGDGRINMILKPKKD